MFSRPNQTPLFIILTVLAAFGLGALHAIEPGHGKALLAFTLVGARATSKQAMILAVSLTVAHTAGVLLLGIVLFFAAGFVSETIYPWITLISGVAIAVIGARILARYVRMRRGLAHAHVHEHDGAHPHLHDHHHGEGQEHGHSHAIPGSQPLNFRSAIWLRSAAASRRVRRRSWCCSRRCACTKSATAFSLSSSLAWDLQPCSAVLASASCTALRGYRAGPDMRASPRTAR